MDLQEEKVVATESLESEPPGAKGLNSWHPEVQTLRRWATKGGLAVLDQALFAGTNFLVNILLARWLEPEGYGAFALGYSLFLLLGTLHTALWTEPMMVYGAKRFREAFGPYQGVLIGDHWRFGFAAALLFLSAALAFAGLGRRELALSFGGLAVAAPTVLYLWLVRRGAYVHLEPRLAAFGGALYLVIYLLLAFFLLRLGFLNEATAYLAMGLAALLAGKAILWRLPKGTGQAVDPREVRTLHWTYGRWALLAGLLSWIPGNFYLWALGAAHGLDATAKYRALGILVTPIVNFNQAAQNVFLPHLAEKNHGVGKRRVFALQLTAQLAFGLPLAVGIAFYGERLIEALYLDKYRAFTNELIPLGLNILVLTFMTAFTTQLKAEEQTRVISLVWGISALLSLLVGSALIISLEVEGALWSNVIVNTCAVMALFWAAKRRSAA